MSDVAVSLINGDLLLTSKAAPTVCALRLPEHSAAGSPEIQFADGSAWMADH